MITETSSVDGSSCLVDITRCNSSVPMHALMYTLIGSTH